jgi:hypothetical protein
MAIHDHAGRRHLVQRQAVGVVSPAAERTTGISPGAPARLRGLVPKWRLPRPLHRGQSGQEIPFSRSPQAAMIGG